MLNKCQLFGIGFSPWVSHKIVTFCEDRATQNGGWYFSNIKTGMETIMMHRNVFYLSLAVLSLAPIVTDKVTLTAVCLASASGIIYSLKTIYDQANKVQTVIEPYLKVSCCGAEVLINAPRAATAPTEPDYGTVTGQAKTDVGAQSAAGENTLNP